MLSCEDVGAVLVGRCADCLKQGDHDFCFNAVSAFIKGILFETSKRNQQKLNVRMLDQKKETIANMENQQILNFDWIKYHFLPATIFGQAIPLWKGGLDASSSMFPKVKSHTYKEIV